MTTNAGLKYQVDQQISTNTAPPSSDTAHTHDSNGESATAGGQGQTPFTNGSAVYDNATEVSHPAPQQHKDPNPVYDNIYGEEDGSSAPTPSFGQAGHRQLRFDYDPGASTTDESVNMAAVQQEASQHAPPTQTGSGRKVIMPPVELLRTSQAHQDSPMTSSRSVEYTTSDTVGLVKH